MSRPLSSSRGQLRGSHSSQKLANNFEEPNESAMEPDLEVNRKISVYKHIKKKAANDAQLLMNRIALIQKEEERARKKIQETKERAAEIISMRMENEKRVQDYVNATGQVRQMQQVMLAKNREQDQEGRKARQQRLAIYHSKKREDVSEMIMEKKYLTTLMLEEQQREISDKQRRRDEVRKNEEMMRWKKEQERLEKERKRKEFYANKLYEEELEAQRAEKLVKALERKEREWIEKLRTAQTVQDSAFGQLEHALETHVPLRVSMSRAQEDGGFPVEQDFVHLQSPQPQQQTPVRPLSSSGGSARGGMRLNPIEQDYEAYYNAQPNTDERSPSGQTSSVQSRSRPKSGTNRTGTKTRKTPGR